MSLPMTAAALGATLELATLDGAAPIHVKAGTQSGTTITLRGQGMPRLRSSGRGDLVVHLEILTPTNMDAAQQDLIRQLSVLRGEEAPIGELHEQSSSLFGKLKDAFSAR
jgi:molecular chaperone DnaJ